MLLLTLLLGYRFLKYRTSLRVLIQIFNRIREPRAARHWGLLAGVEPGVPFATSRFVRFGPR